ncbi:hypothetical protein B0H11DRAFT_502988 [Mycena galericulata]|nr:hypothetical protein B0H11DRAFT_502988 [Mycena galericulata]
MQRNHWQPYASPPSAGQTPSRRRQTGTARADQHGQWVLGERGAAGVRLLRAVRGAVRAARGSAPGPSFSFGGRGGAGASAAGARDGRVLGRVLCSERAKRRGGGEGEEGTTRERQGEGEGGAGEHEREQELFIATGVYEALKEKKRFDGMRGGHQENAEFLGFYLDPLEEEL